MLNYIWSFMIIFAVLISGFTGGMKAITNSALLASGEAVTICIETLGIVAMWMGIMRIAEKSGLIDSLARKMSPILNFYFLQFLKITLPGSILLLILLQTF